MAEDRLPCWRSESIAATSSDKVIRRLTAISLSPLQNASSRLTLVLCPAMTMERLTTGDFIARLPFRSGAGRDFFGLFCRGTAPGLVLPLNAHAQSGSTLPLARPGAAWPACARFGD